MIELTPTQRRLIRSGDFTYCTGDGCRIPVNNKLGLCPTHREFTCKGCGVKQKSLHFGQLNCGVCEKKRNEKARNRGEG